MPSPIAHAAMGYLIYRGFRVHLPREASQRVGPVPHLLIAAVVLSLLPDFDAVPGILTGELGRFHNQFSNSLFVGIGVALSVGVIAWLLKRSNFATWFFFALVCYEVHVLMDYATVGRGVMLFWPLSSERFESPVKLFYGLHWSYGWVSASHLLTLVTEIVFIAFVGLALYLVQKQLKTWR